MNKQYTILLVTVVILNVAVFAGVLYKPQQDSQNTLGANPIQSTSFSDSIGLLGLGEQAAITNIEFTSPNTIDVTVQNSGSKTVAFTKAYVNGVAVSTVPDSPSIARSSSETVALSVPSLTAGASYQITLVTIVGTSVMSHPTTYNP
jgi:hypothetical protein